MIYAFILILLLISWVNKALRTVEHQQRILCYDMQILNQKIKEDENRIW